MSSSALPAASVGLLAMSGRVAPTSGLSARRWLSGDASPAPVAVTASMVKELRARTSSPLMSCKKALSDPEVAGDMDKAIDWLRKQGVATAAKKSGRATNEGLVGVLASADASKACLVECSSETDFVSRNDKFQDMVRDVASVALQLDAGASRDALAAAPLRPGEPESESVADAIVHLAATVGENLSLKDTSVVSAGPAGVVGTYIHNKRSDMAGSQAAVVALEVESPAALAGLVAEQRAELVALANGLAMQLVGGQASFLDGVPAAHAEKERALERERLTKEATDKLAPGKQVDPAVLQKRVEKKVNGLLKKLAAEEVLLNQVYLAGGADAGKLSVAKVLAATSKTLGAKVAIASAVRFQVGVDAQTVLLPVR